MIILEKFIDRLGEWNPQIFRELKERLNLKNLSVATAGSLLIQAFVWFSYSSQIPVPIPYTDSTGASTIQETHNRYCQLIQADKNAYYRSPLCVLDNTLGQLGFKIDWPVWWLDVFTCMSWIMAIGLLLGSVYLLVADLLQEEKRGTLNFIRLSPQSATTIFLGKILGVPSLVYLAAALMVPFHLMAGILAGASIPLLLGWYATIGAGWLLLSSLSTLYVLLGGIQAILTVGVVAWPTGVVIMMINSFASATIERSEWLTKPYEILRWFGIPISASALWLYAFVIGTCAVWTYWIWQALERRYLNPTATVLGKSQSYLLTLCAQIWVAGFAISAMTVKYSAVPQLCFWAIVNFMALFCLIPLLLPSKQALQDWSRYRRERGAHQGQNFWQRDVFKDLLFNDKSPALLAIAIDLGMALALWIPIALLVRDVGMSDVFTTAFRTRFCAGLCLGASLILIYAAIAHLGLFLNFKKRNLWIVGMVATVMFLPIGFAFILSPNNAPKGIAAIMLLFSPFAPVGIFNLAGTTILATFTAQLALLTGLTYQLKRKLQITGQSQTKQLLTHS
jgi:hypothetical protein